MKRLVVCVLLASCGGDGAGGSIDVDNLGSELAIAACERQFSCCTSAEILEQYMGITFEGQPIDSEDRCVSFATAVFGSFAITAYKDSIAKGRMVYDGEAAAACVAMIESLSCAQYGAKEFPESECRPYLIPKVANGGACTQDYECTSDNCIGERTPLGEQPTDGACGPMPTAGQECDENCEGELVCESDPGSSIKTCRESIEEPAPVTCDGI